jgi:hypothetical protein
MSPDVPAQTAEPTARRNRKLIIGAAVVLLAALALGIRFFRLSSQSLWQDEASSLVAATVPLEQAYLYSARMNNSLPTYFLILHEFLGEDVLSEVEFRSRLLSAIAGGLTVPVLIGVVYSWRRKTGPALLAGLLLALNPLHIWYSQEARAYALVLFCGLSAVLFFEYARANREFAAWPFYVVAALAAMLLHKTGFVFPAACALWHSLEVWRGKEKWQALLAHAPMLVLAAGLMMLKSYPPGEGYGRGRSLLEIAYTFATFIGGYSFGPSLTEIQNLGPLAAVMRHIPQVVILGAVLGVIMVACARHLRALFAGREAILLVLGIGVVSLYSMVSGFPFNVRYALPALLGFVALLAYLPEVALNSVWSRLALAGVLMVSLWANVQWFYSPVYAKADARSVAAWLERNRDRITSWTVLPGYSALPLRWYVQRDAELLSRFAAPEDDRTTSFPPVPDVLIIGRRHHVLEPDRLIAAYATAAGNVTFIQSFPGFEVYVRGGAGPAGTVILR